MYDIYLGAILLPIAPEKIKVKINNQNKTITLINHGEINILKQAGLTDVNFSALIPQFNYPFAKYIDGFKPSDFFLNAIEKLKTNQTPFQFIISRFTPSGGKMFSNNITASLERYDINDDVKQGFDITVDFELKQWTDYGTKTFVIPAAALRVASNTTNTQTPPINPSPPTDTVPPTKPPTAASKTSRNNANQTTVQTVQVAPVIKRPANTAPNNTTVTTKAGDTYESVAKSELGDVSKANEIYDLNKTSPILQNILNNSVGEDGKSRTQRYIPPNLQLQLPRSTTTTTRSGGGLRPKVTNVIGGGGGGGFA